tara:strand:+ start:1412 stop:1633 length:222 start_codon:yes stop_codon:yes gene_type:complete
MIPIDREILTTIAAIACIAGLVFLFRELNKAKQEVDELKVFSAHVARHLSQSSGGGKEEPALVAEEVEEKSEE